MREVIVAKTAGFCMGVKRAVEMTLKLLDEVKKPVYMYGALIHNPQVNSMLNDRGVIVIDKDTIPKEGTVVIRAHGITPEVENKLRKSEVKIIDATCPFVTKVQKIIADSISKGYFIIIIGDKGHAEVESYLGYAKNNGVVVDAVQSVQDIPVKNKYCIVAQTTQDVAKYQIIIDSVKERFQGSEIVVHNTICNATSQRQEEAVGLAKSVAVMIVVGGKNSANTKRLVEKCHNQNCPTFFIECAEDISIEEISQYSKIGISAGASTPQWVIDEIVKKLKTQKQKKV